MTRFQRYAAAPDRKYISEFTRFMEDFMKTHPRERQEPRKGWQIFWDKQVDLDAEQKREKSEVPTPAYYYFDSPDAPH